MKKKILILGGSGMFGITLSKFFQYKTNFEVLVGVRSKNKRIDKHISHFYYSNLCNNNNWDKIKKKISNYKPDYIINAVGIVKNSKNIKNMKKINIDFLINLKKLIKKYDFKLIHISTDCVYDGKKGNYSEKTKPNAIDQYGKSKSIAEKYLINEKNCLVLRSSGIGHSPYSKNGILEWFINTKEKQLTGYKKAIFTGPTILEYSKIVLNFLRKKPFTNGLFNIGTKKISKLNLLILINKIYRLKKKVIVGETLKVNRSLNISKFKRKFDYKLNSWENILKEQKNFYEKYF